MQQFSNIFTTRDLLTIQQLDSWGRFFIPVHIRTCLPQLEKRNGPKCKFTVTGVRICTRSAPALGGATVWGQLPAGLSFALLLNCQSDWNSHCRFLRVSRRLTFAAAATGRSHCQVETSAARPLPTFHPAPEKTKSNWRVEITFAINCLRHRLSDSKIWSFQQQLQAQADWRWPLHTHTSHTTFQPKSLTLFLIWFYFYASVCIFIQQL